MFILLMILLIVIPLSKGNPESGGLGNYQVTVNTDKPNYQMGETVTVWGEVSNNGEAVADEDVAIQVGSVLFVDQVPTDSEGQWSTTFVLNPELFQELQAYDVWAWSIGAYDQTSFTIDASDPQPTPQIQEPKRLPEKDFKNPRQRRG